MQADGAIKSAKGQLDMAAIGATRDQLNQINGQINSGKPNWNLQKNRFNACKPCIKILLN